jgi:predicted ester cyclase
VATTTKSTKPGRKKGAKTIAREFFEALGNQDLEKAASMWKPGGKGHLHGMAELEAPRSWRAYFENLFGAFPDFELEALEIAASGNNAGVRWRATGTFTGPARFQGLAPTGARIELEGCDMLRIEDEKIVENNAYTNGAQLAQQLGVLPAEGSLGERAVTAAFNARTAAADAVRRFRARD